MKLTLFLCGVALLMTGCAGYQNPYDNKSGFAYAHDLVPSPLPDLQPDEMQKINELPLTVSPISLTTLRETRADANNVER